MDLLSTESRPSVSSGFIKQTGYSPGASGSSTFSHMDLMIVLTIVLPTVVAIAYCIYLLKGAEREDR